MSLLKSERTLTTYWNAKSAATIPDDIASINLNAVAVNRGSFMLGLTYSFANESKCLQWIKDQKNSVL